MVVKLLNWNFQSPRMGFELKYKILIALEFSTKNNPWVITNKPIRDAKLEIFNKCTMNFFFSIIQYNLFRTTMSMQTQSMYFNLEQNFEKKKCSQLISSCTGMQVKAHVTRDVLHMWLPKVTDNSKNVMTNHIFNLILNLAQIQDSASKWWKCPSNQPRIQSGQILSKQLQNYDIRIVVIKIGQTSPIVKKDYLRPIGPTWQHDAPKICLRPTTSDFAYDCTNGL